MQPKPGTRNLSVLYSLGLSLALSMGFLDVLIGLVGERFWVPEIGFLLLLLAVTTSVYFAGFFILLVLVHSILRLWARPNLFSLASSVASFLMIQFLLLASNNLIVTSTLIHPAGLAKLFLLSAIALLNGVLLYLALARPAGVRAFLSRSLTVLIVVPFWLAQTVGLIWLQKEKLESAWSPQALTMWFGFACLALLTVPLAARIVDARKAALILTSLGGGDLLRPILDPAGGWLYQSAEPLRREQQASYQ